MIGNYAIALKDFMNASPGFVQRWVIDIDLDAGTYDLSMGTQTLLSGESLGEEPHVFGKILVGHTSDSDTLGRFHLGEILVTATEVPVRLELETMGGLKARYRWLCE